MGERCFRKHTCSTTGDSRFESGLALQRRLRDAALLSFYLEKLWPVRSSSSSQYGLIDQDMRALRLECRQGIYGDNGESRSDTRRRFKPGGLHQQRSNERCKYLLWYIGFGYPAHLILCARVGLAAVVAGDPRRWGRGAKKKIHPVWGAKNKEEYI